VLTLRAAAGIFDAGPGVLPRPHDLEVFVFFRLLSLSLACTAAIAFAPHPASARLTPKLERKVAEAARLLDEIMSARDAEIPADLLSDATCIIAIPDLTKGAVGVGGRYGKGLASCRRPDGAWGPPAFLEVGGASIGLQIGGERIDMLLVVRGEDSARWLLRDKFTLGADASVAAGPYGRTAGAATDATLRAGILSYSRSRGAFVGAALDGAVLKQDRTDNRKLYGRAVTAREILLPGKDDDPLPQPGATAAFVESLQRHAPAPAPGE
jgi:lipid-binding SYLF domain-containing protein